MIKINTGKALEIAKTHKLIELNAAYREQPLDVKYTGKKAEIKAAKTLQDAENIIINSI